MSFLRLKASSPQTMTQSPSSTHKTTVPIVNIAQNKPQSLQILNLGVIFFPVSRQIPGMRHFTIDVCYLRQRHIPDGSIVYDWNTSEAEDRSTRA